METKPEETLLKHMDMIHTTEMGVERIRKNLKLGIDVDVVDYCKKIISADHCNIIKKGKNWYCSERGITITVNSFSYTIITAKML